MLCASLLLLWKASCLLAVLPAPPPPPKKGCQGAGTPFSTPHTLRLPHPCAFCKGGRRRLQLSSTFRITGFAEVPLAGLGRAIPLKFTPGGGWVRGSHPCKIRKSGPATRPFLRPKSYSDLFGKRGAGQVHAPLELAKT